ncbi:uncharacterized protein LOC114329441 [Diabrotica virgifera virgifera]|uniref:Uncharacterized protein LOC114329441 n=1 Tax=Diabrotica virgifera virgifera TaxID=50390 RepID=A0A6P7FF18_DIAVI|nr:uncharacterized protein LOC114329441 [Diabrotica virgifera virgifera]
MGNGISHENVDLRDRETERAMPQRISRITSNFIFAPIKGVYYPCVILRPASVIPGGFVVYFFHLKQETEVSPRNIIGNLWTLMYCQVSFIDGLGNVCTGRIIGTDNNISDTNLDQPINFFIQGDCRSVATWISFPYIFLTRDQVEVLGC